MRVLARKEKAIGLDFDVQARISLCVHRQVRAPGHHWCRRVKDFVRDEVECKVCVTGGSAE